MDYDFALTRERVAQIKADNRRLRQIWKEARYLLDFDYGDDAAKGIGALQANMQRLEDAVLEYEKRHPNV